MTSSNSLFVVFSILGCLLCSSLVGCNRQPESLTVQICGDFDVPKELDGIRVAILDEQRQELFAGVLPLLECPQELVRPLPIVLSFEPVLGDLWIVASGFLDEHRIVSAERRIELKEVPSRPITVSLMSECVGFYCPLGQTCVNGECVLVPYEVDESVCEPVQVQLPPPDPDAELDEDVGMPMREPLCPILDAGFPDAEL